MSTNVLLLGRTAIVVDDAHAQLELPEVEIYSGTSLEDLRKVFAETRIDHVIMGAGLDLELRLSIVREVFESSDSTTVHMKDFGSGPQGFLPFVRAVLIGLREL
ncbi:hypothetical protein LTV02_21690 [Nocardia yamanashiensis]|uniref:hypothetical protein n=1 Tax=Nocardia yamanashiensis TaxID=209247 RepID=UPI001E323084|nr:hypothetical protein [Nocardia yamanashiensis]UGT38735.1 hypothetical protein LTV02_21690 [Nocardia yamanashiensis]